MTQRYLTRASSIVCVMALALAGCSWRVETPAPHRPSPDAITQVRDTAAQHEYQVLEATTSVNSGGTPIGIVLNEVEREHAATRLDALGGLYVAHPDASPSPSPEDQPPALIDAVITARDSHLTHALDTADSNLALLLAAAGLSHALSYWYAAWVEDAIGAASAPVVAERTLPSDALTGEARVLPASASSLSESLGGLALMHDQSRYAYEVMAARAIEDERDQWLARRDIQAARGEALASLSGVEDLREATYVTLGDTTADAPARLVTARHLELGLGDAYMALLADADDDQWPWLLHAAFDAYAQAAAYGEPTAEDYPVPALPGIDVN